MLLICYFLNVTNCEIVIYSIPAMDAKVLQLLISLAIGLCCINILVGLYVIGYAGHPTVDTAN